MISSHSKRPTPSSSKRPTTGSSSCPLPIDDAHQIRQSPVFGSNRRSVKPSKPGRPGKSGALYVSTFPSPPTIGCATEKASNSIHSSSPGTSGFTRLRFAICHAPKRKSKSCRPSSMLSLLCVR